MNAIMKNRWPVVRPETSSHQVYCVGDPFPQAFGASKQNTIASHLWRHFSITNKLNKMRELLFCFLLLSDRTVGQTSAMSIANGIPPHSHVFAILVCDVPQSEYAFRCAFIALDLTNTLWYQLETHCFHWQSFAFWLISHTDRQQLDSTFNNFSFFGPNFGTKRRVETQPQCEYEFWQNWFFASYYINTKKGKVKWSSRSNIELWFSKCITVLLFWLHRALPNE